MALQILLFPLPLFFHTHRPLQNALSRRKRRSTQNLNKAMFFQKSGNLKINYRHCQVFLGWKLSQFCRSKIMFLLLWPCGSHCAIWKMMFQQKSHSNGTCKIGPLPSKALRSLSPSLCLATFYTRWQACSAAFPYSLPIWIVQGSKVYKAGFLGKRQLSCVYCY